MTAPVVAEFLAVGAAAAAGLVACLARLALRAAPPSALAPVGRRPA